MLTQTIETDSQIARRSSEALAALLKRGAGKTPMHFRIDDSQEAEILLPLPAVRLLHHALQEMAVPCSSNFFISGWRSD